MVRHPQFFMKSKIIKRIQEAVLVSEMITPYYILLRSLRSLSGIIQGVTEFQVGKNDKTLRKKHSLVIPM